MEVTALLSLLIALALLGFALWAVINFVPMPPAFQRALVAIVVLLVVLWILRAFFGGVFVPLR